MKSNASSINTCVLTAVVIEWSDHTIRRLAASTSSRWQPMLNRRRSSSHPKTTPVFGSKCTASSAHARKRLWYVRLTKLVNSNTAKTIGNLIQIGMINRWKIWTLSFGEMCEFYNSKPWVIIISSRTRNYSNLCLGTRCNQHGTNGSGIRTCPR